jgi:hypothetical protein
MMEIFTYSSNPFKIGGPQRDVISTIIEKFERIDLGKGYFGILIKNPVLPLFHMAEERSGALVGTLKSRAGLIKRIKNDIKAGEKEVMEEQVKIAMREKSQAIELSSRDFFSRFKT